MPSKVLSPSLQVKRFHICRKGTKHAQQPLSLVCLDPICRNDPLICPTCFSEYHKYHRTVPLNEFISDYQGAIHRNHKQSTMERLAKQHQEIKASLSEFKSKIIDKLNSYEESIEEYFSFLYKSLNTREQLSNVLNVALEPKLILQAHSQQEQQTSLSFIISHSLFSPQNRLINVSSLLKYDESRTLALLDKAVNENQNCQRQIQVEMKKLDFARETLSKQSVRIQNIVKEFNQSKIPQVCPQPQNLIVNPKAFVQKQTLNSTLKWTSNINKVNSDNFVASKLSSIFFLQAQTLNQQITTQVPLFVFSNVYKHDKLTITENERRSSIRSNVTALKPQYALICPSVDYQPQREQNWSINIKSCRNFASSKNTLAIGLCQLQQVAGQHFEQNSNQHMKNQYMLTSQGFLIKNGRQEKCNFTFSEGEVLDLKYDPYYRLLVIRKDNGRKVSIKIGDTSQAKLYGCVRLTYASDQVQILNHTNSKQH